MEDRSSVVISGGRTDEKALNPDEHEWRLEATLKIKSRGNYVKKLKRNRQRYKWVCRRCETVMFVSDDAHGNPLHSPCKKKRIFIDQQPFDCAQVTAWRVMKT